MKHHFYLLMTVCALLLSSPQPAAALYLDPATGSMVLQIAIGGLLAVLAAAKLYWTRITSLFQPKRKTEETQAKAN